MTVRYSIGASLVVAASLVAHSAFAATAPGPLVTPQWLNENKDSVVIVDVRENLKTFSVQPAFEVDKTTGARHLVKTGGHIAGAISVDFGKIRQDRVVDGVKIKAQLPTAQYFTEVMDGFGLNKTDKPIVIVATGDSVSSMDMATRLYFQLRYFGEPREKLTILNGGVNAWLQAGLPISTDEPTAVKGNWVAGPEDKEILATLEQVRDGVRNKSAQMLDARPTSQYLGIVKPPVDKTAGHLDGAKSLPTEAITKPVGAAHEFMTPAEYKKIFAHFNIQENAPTVAYCNTGHLASGAWFVSYEIMGNKMSKLYAGSMTEWTNLGNPTVGVMQ